MNLKDVNFEAMPQTALTIITKPSEYFKEMSKTGGFVEPLIFAMMMGLIGGIIQAVINVIGFGRYTGYGNGLIAGLSMIIKMPVYVGIGCFICAAVFFLIWKFMGSQENYETALRCIAYLAALVPLTTIVGVVPYGNIINTIIYVFYLVMVSVHTHNLPSQKAWLVFGIIGAFYAIIGGW